MVGQVNPPTPSGCEAQDGGASSESELYVSVYLKCKDRSTLLLEEIVGHQGNMPIYRVLDEVTIPELAAGQQILRDDCSDPRYTGQTLVAIGKWVKRNKHWWGSKDVRFAWRFNINARKIEAISPTDVVCRLEIID
jgi:hypothetical protein